MFKTRLVERPQLALTAHRLKQHYQNMQYTLDTEDLRSKLTHGDHIKLALLRQFKSLEPLTQALKNHPKGVSQKTLQYAVNLAIYPLHVRRIRIDKKTLKMAVRNNLALRLLTSLKYLKPGYSQQTKARRSHHNMSEFVLHTELGAGYCKSFHKHFNAWLEKFEPAQPERTCQPTPSQMVPGTEHNAGSRDPSS